MQVSTSSDFAVLSHLPCHRGSRLKGKAFVRGHSLASPSAGSPGGRETVAATTDEPESRLSSNHPYEGLTPTCLYPSGLSFEGAAFSLSHHTAPADSSSRSKAETYAAAVRRLRENAQSTGITSQMKKTIPSNPPHPHKKSKPQNNHGLLQPLLP